MEYLNSERAIEVNITIMSAFVKLRQMLESNEELNRKFTAVIRKLSTHDKYFKVVFDELKRLTEQPSPSRKQIGFKADRSHKEIPEKRRNTMQRPMTQSLEECPQITPITQIQID